MTPFSRLRHALCLIAMSAGLSLAQATTPPRQSSPARAPADTTIRIMVITIGQGDVVYELFGHNAIWIHDPSTSSDSVYNWGVFDFRTPGFLPRFLRGDMRYTMDAQTIGTTIAYYQYLGRRMWVQELDLTPAEKRALVDYIHWNYRPENRQYHYNYYLDNCSTRVRDVIDRVLGGQLRTYLKSIPTAETYRSHSLRLMQSAPLLVTGVEVALGRSTDTPINADQASFLPVQLMGFLKDFKVDGGRRPLVLREWMLNDPIQRGPEPSAAPALWKWYLPIGLAIAALILLSWYGLNSGGTAATISAVFMGIVGLVGLILVLLVTVTDHVAAHRNENLFMLNPLWLLLIIAVPRSMIRHRAPGTVARWMLVGAAALSVCAVLIHLVGLSRQPNWDVIALLLPAQLAIAGVAYFAGARPVSEAGKA